jgi:hypothetical protein
LDAQSRTAYLIENAEGRVRRDRDSAIGRRSVSIKA